MLTTSEIAADEYTCLYITYCAYIAVIYIIVIVLYALLW